MKKRAWKRCNYIFINRMEIFCGTFMFNVFKKDEIYKEIIKDIKKTEENVIEIDIKSINFTLSDIK